MHEYVRYVASSVCGGPTGGRQSLSTIDAGRWLMREMLNAAGPGGADHSDMRKLPRLCPRAVSGRAACGVEIDSTGAGKCLVTVRCLHATAE